MRTAALLAGFALALIACTNSGGENSSEAGGTTTLESTTTTGPSTTLPLRGFDTDPNTLVWVHGIEPTSMHFDDPMHRLVIASWIRQSLLEGLYGVSGNTEFYPELLAEEAMVKVADDGSVSISYVLRDGLRWSNGDPLTADHVAYTWDIWRQGCVLDDDGTIGDGTGCVYASGDRSGYNLITDFTVESRREFTVSMVSFYAGWKGLFGEIFHPSFGSLPDGSADAAAVNRAFAEWRTLDGEALVSAGPMIFDEWDKGWSIHLVRNDRYHGSVSPDARNRGVASVDGVLIRFVSSVAEQVQALENGQAHVIMAQPEPELAALVESEGFTVASSAGPVYEHWGFNLLNPHLADPAVREAMAMAIDKRQVVKELYEPLFGPVLPEQGLGNTFWMTNQRAYEDHQARYSGAQTRQAEATLEAAGYERGDDGVFEHPDRGRLSLRVGTTGGVELRERQQTILIDQLARVGIEVVADNVDGEDYFVAQPFHADALLAAVTAGEQGDPGIWDIAQFAWAGSAWPGGNADNYRSARNSNPYGFANADFDALSVTCDTTVENVERAACYNELDRYLTTLEMGPDGLVVIPITQKPSFYGYLSSVLSGAGIASDADAAGPLATVVDFAFKAES